MPLTCARARCEAKLSVRIWRIWNTEVEHRDYCPKCGRKIVDYNPTIRYKIVPNPDQIREMELNGLCPQPSPEAEAAFRRALSKLEVEQSKVPSVAELIILIRHLHAYGDCHHAYSKAPEALQILFASVTGEVPVADSHVVIPVEDLKELQSRDRVLQALEAGGVDNWDGYSDSINNPEYFAEDE